MNVSVVIPVYNGQHTIDELVERLGKVLAGACDQYETVLVCDGSPDDSWNLIEQLAGRYSWVRGIELMRNYGQHNALLCGVRAARYEVIITMDDDLQHPPEEIPVLLEKLGQGYDVVFGIPKKMPHSWWRNLTSVFTKKVVGYVMGYKSIQDISSYRAFRSHIRSAFENYSGPDLLLDVLLTWGTSRFGTVAVNEAPRKVGVSNYNLTRLIKMALTLLTGYTTVPLRFASILGFIFTVVGMLFLIYVVVTYFTLGSIPGFSFLASTLIIFSGVQLFALGIIGEYLARIFDRSYGRPTYQVLKTVGGVDQA
ncbi:MAG TPA: glycosyltransferase family 2 protein [Anaerolineales bacterium]|jgi:undecaprenyl-phosphate 4-deoxy-4-formamido-L-arabinose transferase